MKLIFFLLIAFLFSCVVTLKTRQEEAVQKIIELDQTILLQDSLIQVIQKSNSKYLPIAVKCNKEH